MANLKFEIRFSRNFSVQFTIFVLDVKFSKEFSEIRDTFDERNFTRNFTSKTKVPVVGLMCDRIV